MKNCLKCFWCRIALGTKTFKCKLNPNNSCSERKALQRFFNCEEGKKC